MAKQKQNDSLAALMGFKKAMDSKKISPEAPKKDVIESKEEAPVIKKEEDKKTFSNKQPTNDIKDANETKSANKITTEKKKESSEINDNDLIIKEDDKITKKKPGRKKTSQEQSKSMNITFFISEQGKEFLSDYAISSEISAGKLFAKIVREEEKKGMDAALVKKYKGRERGLNCTQIRLDLDTIELSAQLAKKYCMSRSSFYRYVIERFMQENHI